jgi:hypothetical protein
MVGKDLLYGFRLHVVQNRFEDEELYQGLAGVLVRLKKVHSQTII